MSEVNPSDIEVETQVHQVPWEEQFEDHENKIEEYIKTVFFVVAVSTEPFAEKLNFKQSFAASRLPTQLILLVADSS